MLKIDTARRESVKPKIVRYARRGTLYMAAFAVLLVTQAAPADPKADSQKTANIAMMKKILDARANLFSSLKGAQLAKDRKGDPTWAGTVNPFGLHCEVVLGDGLQAYYCTNTALGLQRSSKTGLSDEAAGAAWNSLITDFREAAPELKWTQSRKGPHEFQEMLGTQADGKYAVDVEMISLSADGDRDDAIVNFYVFATPLTHDPMEKQ